MSAAEMLVLPLSASLVTTFKTPCAAHHLLSDAGLLINVICQAHQQQAVKFTFLAHAL